MDIPNFPNIGTVVCGSLAWQMQNPCTVLLHFEKACRATLRCPTTAFRCPYFVLAAQSKIGNEEANMRKNTKSQKENHDRGGKKFQK